MFACFYIHSILTCNEQTFFDILITIQRHFWVLRSFLCLCLNSFFKLSNICLYIISLYFDIFSLFNLWKIINLNIKKQQEFHLDYNKYLVINYVKTWNRTWKTRFTHSKQSSLIMITISDLLILISMLRIQITYNSIILKIKCLRKNIFSYWVCNNA